ncbi:MAG: hypothetical protein WC175_03010 [Candidatus Dojkabacteria bacterium]
MSREKEIDDGKYVSFYLGSPHISELDLILKLDGSYRNRSDLVRKLIEKAYSEKMMECKSELVKNKNVLEEQIKAIDMIELIDKEGIDKFKAIYKSFRTNIPLEHMVHSEDISKKFIEKHMKASRGVPGLADLFPGCSVENIYNKLESMMDEEY